MIENKWGYNLRGSDYWQCEWFGTKEEAIKAALDEKEDYKIDTDTFQIGQLSKYSPPVVDFGTIFEEVAVQAYDDCGECAESWLNEKYIPKDIMNKYNEKLNNLFMEFLKEAGEIPSFGRIVNVEVVGI